MKMDGPASLDGPRVVGHAYGCVQGAEEEGKVRGAVDVHEGCEAADDKRGLVLFVNSM